MRRKAAVKGDLVRRGEIQIPFLYQPRDYQIDNLFKPIQAGKRRVGMVWHRRAGKDKSCFNLMISEACQTVGTYYYIFPLQNQGRKDLWEARGKDGHKFLDHIPDSLLAAKPHDTEMKIRLWNGSIIQIVGTDNAHSLRGSNPIGLVFSEFSYADPDLWRVMRPVLAENGGWAIFNFTPNSQNHAWELYHHTKDNPRWHWSVLTVDDTHRADGSPVVTQEMIEEDRASGEDEDFIQQEYYCSFTGVMFGSYYGHLMADAEKEGRIGEFLYDPRYPVKTAWDLGISDYTAIWFYQQHGRKIYFIDYYENSGEAINHYVTHLYRQKYMYDQFFLPHDAKKRDLTTGKNIVDIMTELTGQGRQFTVVPKGSVQEGIDMSRLLLPRCHFDKVKCKRGIAALKQYHKKWDESRKVFSSSPLHDWSSHGADGFRTFSMSYEEEPELVRERVFDHRPQPSGASWMGA